MSDSLQGNALRQSLVAAWLMTAIAAAGMAVAAAAWWADRGDAVPLPPSPLATLGDDEQLPPPDEFPVRWGDSVHLGAYLGRTGVAFVILEQVRGRLAVGAPVPTQGNNLYGLRIGAAIDSATSMEAANYRFELIDTAGATYAPAAVSTPGRLLPGPALNLYEVYFALPIQAKPSRVTIATHQASLTLPACPVSSDDPALSP